MYGLIRQETITLFDGYSTEDPRNEILLSRIDVFHKDTTDL